MSRSWEVAKNPGPMPGAVEKALAELHLGGPGLYLWGAPGVGKTIALRVASRRLRAPFWSDRAIIRTHRRLMEPWPAEELRSIRRDLDDLALARAACLDDLASGRATAYTDYEAGILGDLIDQWWERGTTLVVASNIGPREIAPLLGERAVSRIVGMCAVLEYQGQDRRLPGRTE